MTTNFEEAKKSFIEFWNDNNSLHEQAKNTFLNMIKAFLDDEHIVIASITGRVKDRDECIKKFERKYRTSLEEEGKEYKIQKVI